MDRRTFRLFALTLAAIVVVVAIAATFAGEIRRGRDPEGPAGEQVVGIVTSVDSEGLSKVRGFTLRDGDGRDLAFRVGVLENAVEFPPAHLPEHQILGTPVRVWYRTEGTELVAFRLEDTE